MIKKYFKFLSYENFDKDQEKIQKENRIGIDLIVITSLVILAINITLRYAVGRSYVHLVTLNWEILYYIVADFLYFAFLRRRKSNFTFWIYIFEAPILLIVMFDAIIYEPNTTTFMFMIFLMVLPLFILDKFWRIMLFVAAFAVLYAIVAYRIELHGVFVMDMIHLVNVVLMNFGAGLFLSIVRMRNIKYADDFATIADEDPLTGLYNRAGAVHRVDAVEPGIFVYLDLDKFKGVNDSFGHDQGDHVLIETADALRMNFRREDVIIRLGGDEFAVFSPGPWTMESTEKKLQSLLDSIHEMAMKGNETMTASIGCAFAPDGADSLEELIKVSDAAMYEAKKSGKNGYRITQVSR